MASISASFRRSALGFDLVPPLSLGFSILVGGVRDMLSPLNGSFHLGPLGDLTTCPCFLFYVLVRSPASVPSKYQLLFGSWLCVCPLAMKIHFLIRKQTSKQLNNQKPVKRKPYHKPSLIVHPHLLVWVTSERFLPAGGALLELVKPMRATGCNQHWYSPFFGDPHQ